MPTAKDEFIPCELKTLEGETLLEAAATAIRINPVNRAVILNRAEAAGIDLLDTALIAILTDRKWRTDGVTLSVSYMDTPPPSLRTRILSHMNAWGETAKVNFSETAGVGEVRIARTLTGHWSHLGTDILSVPHSKQTMNLHGFSTSTPDSELRRVVRHETGHTLGFPHEHLRKSLVERLVEDRVITFYRAKYGWDEATTRAQVLTPIADSAIVASGGPDEDSIMCYEIPGTLTADGVPIRGGRDINSRDAAFAAACYPKPN